MGIIKSGKVVIVLSGRYAGRKGVVVKTFDEGGSDRKFSHAIVAGIERYPRKVTRAMTKEKITKRSKIKPFVKYLNYSHLMPTRYVVDMDNLKKVVETHGMKENQRGEKHCEEQIGDVDGQLSKEQRETIEPRERRCAVCGQRATKVCAACKGVYLPEEYTRHTGPREKGLGIAYCGRECQRIDWRRHRKSCKRVTITVRMMSGEEKIRDERRLDEKRRSETRRESKRREEKRRGEKRIYDNI